MFGRALNLDKPQLEQVEEDERKLIEKSYGVLLIVGVCTNCNSKVGSRCLKGMGHINPLIEEFNSASKEHDYRKKTKSKTSPDRNEFLTTLPEVLKKFIITDLHRLCPLMASQKQRPCSKDEIVPPVTELGACLSGGGISSSKSSVPSAAEPFSLTYERKIG